MFCPECGEKNEDDALFCIRCGAELAFSHPDEDEVNDPENAFEEVTGKPAGEDSSGPDAENAPGKEALPEEGDLPEGETAAEGAAVPEEDTVPEEETIPEEETVPKEDAPEEDGSDAGAGASRVLEPDDDYYEEELAKLEAIYGLVDDDDDEEADDGEPARRSSRRREEDDDYIEPGKTKRRKKRKGGSSKTVVIVLVELIALAAALYGIYTQLEARYGAAAVAENYFVSLVNGDYSEAYSMLSLETTDLTGENAFRSVMENRSFGDVTACSAVFDHDQTVAVTCTTEDGTGQQTTDIQVVKAGKKWGLIDEWKIDGRTLLATNCTITVLTGANLYLDGSQLPSSCMTDSSDGVDTYALTELFAGKHALSVSADGYSQLDETLEISGDAQSIQLTDMALTEASVVKLDEQAASDMQTLYEAAAKGEDFSTVASLFTSDEAKLTDIKAGYEALAAFLGKEDLLNVYFEQMPAVGNTASTDVTITYEYAIDYEAANDQGYLETRRAQQSASSVFSYVLENGSFVLSAFPCEPLEY